MVKPHPATLNLDSFWYLQVWTSSQTADNKSERELHAYSGPLLCLSSTRNPPPKKKERNVAVSFRFPPKYQPKYGAPKKGHALHICLSLPCHFAHGISVPGLRRQEPPRALGQREVREPRRQAYATAPAVGWIRGQVGSEFEARLSVVFFPQDKQACLKLGPPDWRG